MFKKKRIWLVMALLALALVLYGCTQLWDLAGFKSTDEQGGLQPLSAASNQFEVVNGKVRVLIGFTQRPGPPEEAMVRGLGGEIRYTYHLVPAIAASIPEAAIQGLLRNPKVTRIEPDIAIYAVDAELDNSWGVKHIGAGIVHDGGNKGTGVRIAIIDSGIDYTHIDLADNYAGGYDFVNTDDDPMDVDGHGTHVAGTIAAEDNGFGVVGVAPEADIYALKVLEGGTGNYSDVIAALEWVVDYGEIQVTNNSYGSSSDPGELVKAAFDNAYAAGVLHVAAAGNSGNPPGKGDNVIYPARYESCIAVAATDLSDKRARWSSTGPALELSAPGVEINSTLLGGEYGEKNGTSMASPHVAGTAALVWVAYPLWANADVRTQLQNTADDLGDTGWDSKYGYGLVDADEAAGEVVSITDMAITAISAPSSVVQGEVVSVEVTVENVGNQDVSDTIDVSLTDTPPSDGTAGTVSDPQTINGLAAGASTILIFSWDTSSASLGDHTLTASHDFADYDATNDSKSTTVSVVEEVAATAYLSIEMTTESRTAGPNTFTNAVATVTVVDANNQAIVGATVSGSWSGLTTDTGSELTGDDGVAIIRSDAVKNASGTFTFTVESVTKDGITYELSGETSDLIIVP